MRKTFQIDGYAVNKRGLTAGIHYTMTSIGPETTKDTAQLLVQKGEYKHVRVNFIREAKSA